MKFENQNIIIDGLDKIIQIPDITFLTSKSKRQLSGIYTSQMRVEQKCKDINNTKLLK